MKNPCKDCIVFTMCKIKNDKWVEYYKDCTTIPYYHASFMLRHECDILEQYLDKKFSYKVPPNCKIDIFMRKIFSNEKSM